MDNIKDALLRFTNAAMLAKKIDAALAEHGYGETPYAEIFGEISEGIYALLEEHTERFSDSATSSMLNAPCLNNERRAACLAYVYRQNHGQPRPNTIEPDEMREMVKENSGYMHETPEGDWS